MNLLKGIPKTQEPGIYMIYNMANSRVYIGQTKNLHKRAMQHKTSLDCGQHYSEAMQKDFLKGDKMMFVVLEKVCDKTKDRRIMELEYELTFKANGYSLYNKESEKQIKSHLAYAIRRENEKKICEKIGKPISRLKQYNIWNLETTLRQHE